MIQFFGRGVAVCSCGLCVFSYLTNRFTPPHAKSARKIGFNIKAAVPMHTIPRVQWAKQAIVPTLYLTGTADVEAPAAMVRRAFAANSQPGSRIANLVGAAHDEPSHFAEGRMNRYVALFVRCHTVQDVEACQYVEAMCSAYNYEDCDAKVSIKIEEVGASKEKVQKSCPVCMAYFFVLLFFLFVCLFPSCTNERLFGK
ncbi:hypothetical protein DIPPA_29323 [Diplonema papillatum]|nr:hypothetical protein DIPPA_29323 [Diplonema papillatum]